MFAVQHGQMRNGEPNEKAAIPEAEAKPEPNEGEEGNDQDINS